MTIFVSGPTEATTAPTTAPPGTTQPPLTVLPTAVATMARRSSPSTRRSSITRRSPSGNHPAGRPERGHRPGHLGLGQRDPRHQNTLATHVYRAAGDSTIGVGVIQSEVGAPEKRLTATTSFPVSITQVPGTYTSGTPMPNGTGFLGGLQIPELRLFGINIFPLLVILLVGLLIGGFLFLKSREQHSPEIPTTDAIEQAAAAYQEARVRGDLFAAKRYALDAARLLVIQAETVPKYGNAYLEKAEIWKEIARTIDNQPAGPLPEPPGMPAPGPIGAAGMMAAANGGVPAGEAADTGGDLLAGTDVEPGVFDAVLRIALEIAREGREGKPVGTAFLVGDVDGVLAYRPSSS